jgi:hypothetical protein
MVSLPPTLTQAPWVSLLDWAFMYAKTNPRAGRLSSRQKRVFAIVGVLIIGVLGGLFAWGALAHDSYGSSGHGCVNVTVPSSTGGATLHYCGAPARAFCLTAFRSQDQISLRARPQCVLAGLGPAGPSSPSSRTS